MTALAALRLEEIVSMETQARIFFNGGRIAQIDVSPTGGNMEEVHICECIADDFLSRSKPADFSFVGEKMVVSCDSGSFAFEIEYFDDRLEKAARRISRRHFIFSKRNNGFSFIS